MGTWTSVSKLSVVLETGRQEGETTSNISNIGVMASIQPTDDNGNPITVTADELKKNTTLIDYVDESPLEKSSESAWYYKEDEKFVARSGATPQIKYYVYNNGSPTLRTRSIGVRVKTTSGAELYSSLNGTYHSSVHIVVAH